MRRLALVFALLILAVNSAHAQAVMPLAAMDSSIGHVDVLFDLPKDVPYTGEMILLRVRSTIRGFVTLDELRQPPLTNFSWQQLGQDKPIHAMVDGFDVPGIERDIAIFPQQPGRLIIDPFVRHVTLAVGENLRVETDFASKPVFIDVQRHDGMGHPGDWWLPSSSLTYRETWSPEPGQIEPGKVARRTLTIEAAGMTAGGLPPPPNMRAPGIITFTGPVTRETILTANGPLARATYQWDLRPVSNSPAKLPALQIPWFDVRERRMRVTSVPERWVAYAGTQIDEHHGPGLLAGGQILAAGPLAAGFAGFFWAVCLGIFVLWPRPGRSRFPGTFKRRELRVLSRAARQGKPEAVKAALMALARCDGPRWRRATGDEALAARLAQLDTALFSRAPGDMPALKPLARDVCRAWAAAGGLDGYGASGGLPPIDGDLLPSAGFWEQVRKRTSRSR